MSESITADPGFCTVTSWIQLGYGLWVSLTMVGIGLAFGFPAVTIPQLNEANSTITITTSDESWIASVLTLVAPAGCLVCGYMMDTLGRKLILIICQLPLCVGWLLTGFAADAKQIIIGRIITGLGIGMSMGAPRIYVTEISLPNMRGTVGALPNLAMSMGLTILAAFGAFLKWTTICYVCGAYSLFLFLFNMLLPETPYFVLLKGTEENARKTLKWFRSKKYKVDREINDLMEYKTVNNIHYSLKKSYAFCSLKECADHSGLYSFIFYYHRFQGLQSFSCGP
ncbi:facilitated trehalose transporter Tret1-like [Ostrinia furnacalis]|uniref:facilitated trehalose transporter Tret1-like n=1 Tax=Ostrinia furnacalis TaxID=93504 RepID=UPI00103DAE32|nr:facilitated trehalose transporter Tret1-like [Ostrinia furnacalis]